MDHPGKEKRRGERGNRASKAFTALPCMIKRSKISRSVTLSETRLEVPQIFVDAFSLSPRSEVAITSDAPLSKCCPDLNRPSTLFIVPLGCERFAPSGESKQLASDTKRAPLADVCT